jgi:hypothetical protein
VKFFSSCAQALPVSYSPAIAAYTAKLPDLLTEILTLLQSRPLRRFHQERQPAEVSQRSLRWANGDAQTRCSRLEIVLLSPWATRLQRQHDSRQSSCGIAGGDLKSGGASLSPCDGQMGVRKPAVLALKLYYYHLGRHVSSVSTTVDSREYEWAHSRDGAFCNLEPPVFVTPPNQRRRIAGKDCLSWRENQPHRH